MDPAFQEKIATLAEKHEHVGDKHDSAYALALEETRKATVKSMPQKPGIASKLMWIYWHHDPDSQWYGNWVLLHVTTHENAGMTRVMVHEVMHNTTAVKVKKTATRMRTSGGTRVRMCTPGEYSGHCANKDWCVCVSKTFGFSRLW